MGVFPKIKMARGKADHFPPTKAKVKYEWCYNSTLPACFHGTDKKIFTYFTFTLLTLCRIYVIQISVNFSSLLTFFLSNSPQGKG